MGIKFLLDSVILIDHLNGRKDATGYLLKVRYSAAVSVVTRTEVLVPYDAKEAVPVTRLLDAFPTLPIDVAVADRAAALRFQHGGGCRTPFRPRWRTSTNSSW